MFTNFNTSTKHICRADRYLRKMESLKREHAHLVLSCIMDDNLFLQNIDTIEQLGFTHEIHFLRRVCKANDEKYTYISLNNNGTLKKDDIRELPNKKIRIDINPYLLEISDSIVEKILSLINVMKDTNYRTSYDMLIEAVHQSYMYHPKSALRAFRKVFYQNPWEYRGYIHLMEPYRQTGRKLDCLKATTLAKRLADIELNYIRQDMSLFPEDIQDLKLEETRTMTARLIFLGINNFFKDSGNPKTFSALRQALQHSPKSIYALLNLGIVYLFNAFGNRNFCTTAAELLLSAIENTGITDKDVVLSFLYHTVSQIFLRLQKIDEALKYLELSLVANDKMILAYFDRSSLYRSLGKYDLALKDSDVLIEIKPELPYERSNIYCIRATLFASMLQGEKSIEAILEAIKQDPTNVFPYTILLTEFVNTDQIDKFIELSDCVPLEQVSDPTQIRTYLYHQAEAYRNFNDHEKSQEYLNKFNNHQNSWFRID